jgi:Tol biopolymer transport system component
LRSRSPSLRAIASWRLANAALAGVLAIAPAGGCSDPTASEPARSEQIIFLSTRDGAMDGAAQLWEIYRMNPDGRGVDNISRHPTNYSHLDVTPDGRTVIFSAFHPRGATWTSASDCPYRVWRMALDGSQLRPITFGGCSTNPRQSPDGTRVAYQRGNEIHVTGLDGVGADHATRALEPVAPSPCGVTPRATVLLLGWIAPDMLSFQRHVCGAGTTYYVVGAAGDGLRAVEEFYPAHSYLSPDRTRIAITHPGSASTQADVSIMNLDGSGRRLVAVGAYLPSRLYEDRSPWSPDGRSIYFRVGDSHFIAPVDGGAPGQLALPREFVFSGWSRRGDRIAWTAYGSNASHVYVTDADGGGAVNLTNSASRNELPVWVSPR